MKSDLTGRVIAVTGAAQGIGRAMAERFASRGAQLVISDINEETLSETVEEMRATGTEVSGVVADVTSAEDCERVMNTATSDFGALTGVVCNAGAVHVGPFLELTGEDWSRVLNVNVVGTFLTIQAAARAMKASPAPEHSGPKGKILTMSSIAGRYAAGPMAPVIPHYRAAKAAVISLTHSASYTLAPDITVNAMCPGLVATDMWKRIDEAWSAAEGWEPGTAWKLRTDVVPLGRPQTSEDVANLAEFLMSEGSDYMTGQSINVDGGLTVG
jgi:meso-butanediol dehydrogenase/(S,S)-butanediol dehydrogenase/diacetyl reductase